MPATSQAQFHHGGIDRKIKITFINGCFNSLSVLSFREIKLSVNKKKKWKSTILKKMAAGGKLRTSGFLKINGLYKLIQKNI